MSINLKNKTVVLFRKYGLKQLTNNLNWIIIKEIKEKPMQYTKLKERTDQPNFAYVVLIERKRGCLEDYYLFKADEFEEAYDVLKSEAAKDEGSFSRICEIGFNNSDRTYYLKPIFRIWNGKVIYDKYDEPLLHVTWYINAGQWLNPREDI